MAFEQVGVQFIAQGGDTYITTMSHATNATNTFVDSTEKGGGRVSAAGEIMTGALRHVGEFAVDAFAKAAQATAGFLKDSVDVAGQFQGKLQEFGAAAGKGFEPGSEGLKKFHDQFIQLGKDLPVSTTEVEDAAIALVKGGLDPATVAGGALERSLQFAGASMKGDLVAAAELGIKQLGTFVGSAASAEEQNTFLAHSYDVITKAANASTLDADKLGQALLAAGGSAKASGVDYDDFVATMGLISPQFSSAAEAGTSYKNFLARLIPSTDNAKDKMQELGLWTKETGSVFYDANGAFIGNREAADILQKTLGGLSDAQKADTLQTLFGNDAKNAAVALIDEGAAGYDRFIQKMADANGVQEQAAATQQGYDFAMKNFQGSIEALQITVSEKLLPVLTSFLNDVLMPGVNTVITFSEALFGSDDAFNKLDPTMQAIVSTIDVLVADTQDLIGAFQSGGAMSSDFASALGYLADDLGLPGDMIAGIVFAMQDLIASFQEGNVATESLQTTSEQVFGTLNTYIPGIMASIRSIVGDALKIISDFWRQNGTEIMAFVQATWKTISDLFNTVMVFILKLTSGKLAEMAAFWHTHHEEILTALKGAWQVIEGLITAALAIVSGVIKTTLALISGDWSGAWKALNEMTLGIVEGLKKIITGGLNIIAAAFGTNMDAIGKTWDKGMQFLVDLGNAIMGDLVDIGANIVASLKNGIAGAWSRFTGWVQSKIQELPQAVRDAIGMHSPAVPFVEIGENLPMSIGVGITNAMPQLLDDLRAMGDDIAKGAQEIMDNVGDLIAGGFSSSANMDRQRLANRKALGELTTSQGTAAAQLNQAERESSGMADPKQAAAWLKMRSQQIIELGKLQEQIDSATNEKQRRDLIGQWQLVDRAQQADISAFQAQAASAANPVQELIQQISDFFSSNTGHGDDPAFISLFHLMEQLQQGTVATPATAGQMASGGGTAYTYQNNYTMPIYTNNSPAALQQSLAVLEATTP